MRWLATFVPLLLAAGCASPVPPLADDPILLSKQFTLYREDTYRVEIQLLPGETVTWAWNGTNTVRYYATVYTEGMADVILQSYHGKTEHGNFTGFPSGRQTLALGWRHEEIASSISLVVTGLGEVRFNGPADS